jgi:hypothetical protein
MPPPQERFDAADVAVGQVDDWLVVDDEFVAVDGASQRLLQKQPPPEAVE